MEFRKSTLEGVGEMNILVTGATGFIGSFLTERLVKEKHKVIILKRSTSNIWRIKEIFDKLVSYDVDRVSIESIFKREKIDMVLHLATNYKKFHSSKDVEIIIDSNIKFPSLILEYAKENDVKYFINTGTFFEYEFVNKEPIREESPKKAYNFYACSKLAFEETLKFYTQNYNIRGITLKLFAPYGYKDNEYKLIPSLIKKALNNETIFLTKGEQMLDFTYVKDIVEAYLRSMNYIQIMSTKYDVFNIGTGKAYSVKELVSLTSEIIGKKLKVEWGAIPYSKNEIFYACADITKASIKLHWSPKYSLVEGLKETINWYREKEGKNDI